MRGKRRSPLARVAKATAMIAATGAGSLALFGGGPVSLGRAVSGSAGGLDLTSLALGDGKRSTSGPRRGWVYSCRSRFGGGGATGTGTWINGTRWDLTEKPTVDGRVSWSGARLKVRRVGRRRRLSGNGLPRHTTGIYPIRTSDDAYAFDRNPNRIGAYALRVNLPANPRRAKRASCVGLGTIGVLNSGAALFNALDGPGRDAVAHEIQDRCGGHPERTGVYHYHSLPICWGNGSTKRHSRRIGWALDGFPIYGPRGWGGRYMRNASLDACHGHTHKIWLNGRHRRRYHYHATLEYPYTLGCFRGTPVR
jgi:hypothetical protein